LETEQKWKTGVNKTDIANMKIGMEF